MMQPPSPPVILVVDDDEGLLLLMEQVLQPHGYEVAAVKSGAAALAWLEGRSATLMLLDLKLTDIGGSALLTRLREKERLVPFIVVTGQGDEKAAIEMIKQGARDYVIKDTGLLDLLPEVVRRALASIEQDRALAAAEAGLRESEARLAAAILATNDGIWEWRLPREGVHLSDRWKAILGYRPDEFPNELAAWRALIHPEDRTRLNKAYEAFLKGNHPLFSIEYRLRHRDGTYRWILARAFLHRDADGRPLRMTGAHTDITERRHLEKEILEISERERQRIGADLHDGIGQQLTAIELLCAALKNDAAGTRRPALAQQADRIGLLLRKTIMQARSLARGLAPIADHPGALRAGLAELAVSIDSLGIVRCRLESPEDIAVADISAAGHLYRIAQEAVNNAVKHSRAREVIIRLEREDEALRLHVCDDGGGFSEAPSRGIGLPMMRQRASVIGAELALESTPGRGVRITCTLPILHEAKHKAKDAGGR